MKLHKIKKNSTLDLNNKQLKFRNELSKEKKQLPKFNDFSDNSFFEDESKCLSSIIGFESLRFIEDGFFKTGSSDFHMISDI